MPALKPPGSRSYSFLPGLRLTIRGDGAALRHFDHEYGPRAMDAPPPDPEVTIAFVDAAPERLPPSDAARTAKGGHKSVRWQVALSDAPERPFHAAIELRGRPRSFGLSLVQGYFVEALLSLAAPGSGHVLLPAAAIDADGGPVLILGPSGAGKSSVSAMAIARGHTVIGDDQVFLDAVGRCTAFPRRMRFYPDLRDTAPDAYRALPWRTRALLRGRGIVDRLTGGYVRPSLAVDPADLGHGRELTSGQIRRVLLIEPKAQVANLTLTPGDTVGLLADVRGLFDSQRARLWTVAPARWREATSQIAVQEEQIIASALEGLPFERVLLPAAWPARRSVEALAGMLGLAT